MHAIEVDLVDPEDHRLKLGWMYLKAESLEDIIDCQELGCSCHPIRGTCSVLLPLDTLLHYVSKVRHYCLNDLSSL